MQLNCINLNYTEIKKYLSPEYKIVITSHMSPDADAVGSSVALRNTILDFGGTATIVLPDEYPEFISWMSPDIEILKANTDIEKVEKVVSEADVIFLLDYNNLSRVGVVLGSLIEKSYAVKILIDHHQQPDEFDYVFSDTRASSTCEMIFDLIEKVNYLNHLDTLGAEAIYAGIMTDTGNFRFNSTSQRTHEVAAKLLNHGVVPDKIYHLIHDQNSVDRLKLLGFVIENRMKYYKALNTICFYLTLQDKKDFNFKKGDSEGFVNYGLSVRGVVFSVFFSEDEKLVKMSFRSKGNFNVNQFARTHFSGGGHFNAAGGRSLDSIDDTVFNFSKLITTYKEPLTNVKIYNK